MAGDARVMSKNVFRAIVIGLSLAAFTQFFALAITGGGHGWTTPFWFSPVLFVLNPVAFVRVVGEQKKALGIDIVLVVIGVALDAGLYVQTVAEGVQYFRGATLLNGVWLALWSAWQVAVLVALARTIALRCRPLEGGE